MHTSILLTKLTVKNMNLVEKSFSGAGELKKHTHDNIHNGENDQNDLKLQFLGNILPWSTRGKNSLLCPETR